MRIKLLFNYKNLNQKINQIKFIKELFGLGLKEAKDTVDSGEFIPQCECDGNIVEMIRSNSNANIEVVILSPQEYEKERKELMKYKSLYLDLIGSIRSVIDSFPKE